MKKKYEDMTPEEYSNTVIGRAYNLMVDLENYFGLTSPTNKIKETQGILTQSGIRYSEKAPDSHFFAGLSLGERVDSKGNPV